MPIDPDIGASVGGNLIGTGLNIMNDRWNRKWQEKQNDKDRGFQEHMYDKSRADSLADWERTNKYNSPEQQMQRLREAGLNPNLVYGKGADNTAVMIKGGQQGTGSQPAPQSRMDYQAAINNALTSYMNIKQQSAVTDNLNKQNALIQADTALRLAQAETQKSIKAGQDLQNIKYGSETKLLDFDYAQKLRLKDINVQGSILDNELKSQAITLNANKYELEKMKTSSDVKYQFQQMLESKARVTGLQIENMIKQNTSQTIIDYKKEELNLIRQNLENLKKQGVLLNGQTVLQELEKQIKNIEIKMQNKYRDDREMRQNDAQYWQNQQLRKKALFDWDFGQGDIINNVWPD